MNLICRTLGHRTESYSTGTYRRHGHWCEGFSHRCTRCREEGYYPPGEPALIPDFAEWFRWRVNCLRRRWHRDCSCCRKPERRYGRPVGDHRMCDEVPF